MRQSNKVRKHSLAVLVLLILNSTAFAQPYLYDVMTLHDPRLSQAEQTNDYRIFRKSLRTGIVDTLEYSAGIVPRLFVNSDESRLLLGYEGSLDIKNASNLGYVYKEIKFDSNYIVSEMLDAPKTNRLFITFVKNWQTEGPGSYTLVLDRTTYSILDSTSTFEVAVSYLGPRNQFFSKDGRYLYTFINAQRTGLYFDITDAMTGRTFARKQCGTMGNFELGPTFHDGRNGLSVVGFKYASGFANQQYAFCDVDAGKVTAILSFPWRSEVQVSADGMRALIEEIPWNNGPVPSGQFWIFSTETGQLLQKVSLPARGQILTFDNYPGEFFYYNAYTNVSIILDANATTPAAVLLDSLVLMKHQAQTSGWIGNSEFITELDNGLENAKKHLDQEDSSNCSKELTVFQNKIKAEFEKKSLSQSPRFVTEDGYKLLYFNAQYIIDRLPKK